MNNIDEHSFMIIAIFDNFIHTFLDKETRGLAMINLNHELATLNDPEAEKFIYRHTNNYLTKYRKAWWFNKHKVYPEARKKLLYEILQGS